VLTCHHSLAEKRDMENGEFIQKYSYALRIPICFFEIDCACLRVQETCIKMIERAKNGLKTIV